MTIEEAVALVTECTDALEADGWVLDAAWRNDNTADLVIYDGTDAERGAAAYDRFRHDGWQT